MRTIANENTKSIRQAMDVMCGIDETTLPVTYIESTNFLDEYINNAKLTDNISAVETTDLSGVGFRLDGEAEYPTNTVLTAGKFGLISEFPADLSGNFSDTEKPRINFKWDKSSEISNITFILYTRDQFWKILRVESTSNDSDYYYCDYTFEEGPANERLYINRIVVGESFVFRNNNLVSCNLVLRGISSTIEDFNLQTSEINITAYMNDELDTTIYGRYSKFLENSPIYYTAGYVGDMSPLRRFYLSEPITDNGDHTITIKGEDATRFLNEDYSGKFLKYNTGENMYQYFEEIKNILTKAGISYTTVGTIPTFTESSAANSSSNILIPNESKKKIIAKACFAMKARDPATYKYIANVQYVDAGIPTLYASFSGTVYKITEFEDPVIKSEIMTKKMRAAWRCVADSSVWSDIETISEPGLYIKETSDPYTDFQVTGSGNTIEKITPYKYKVNITVEGTIQGKKIEIITPEGSAYLYDTEGYSHYQWENIKGKTLTLGEIDGPLVTRVSDTNTKPVNQDALVYALTAYNPRTYTFKWRGDPKLQPGQKVYLHYGKPFVRQPYIKIDSITLDHDEGGLTSTITGREFGYHVDETDNN